MEEIWIQVLSNGFAVALVLIYLFKLRPAEEKRYDERELRLQAHLDMEHEEHRHTIENMLQACKEQISTIVEGLRGSIDRSNEINAKLYNAYMRSGSNCKVDNVKERIA
jgi:hypothetical protein